MSQAAGRIRVTAPSPEPGTGLVADARGCPSSALCPEVCRTGDRARVAVRLGGAFKTPQKQIMPTAPGLRGQVGGVGLGKVQRGGDLPGDGDAQTGQLSALVWV